MEPGKYEGEKMGCSINTGMKDKRWQSAKSVTVSEEEAEAYVEPTFRKWLLERFGVSGHGSTKAALDELEKRITKIAEQLLIHIEIANELIPKVEDRLTALEAKEKGRENIVRGWVTKAEVRLRDLEKLTENQQQELGQHFASIALVERSLREKPMEAKDAPVVECLFCKTQLRKLIGGSNYICDECFEPAAKKQPPDICSKCGGTGEVPASCMGPEVPGIPCAVCNGTGKAIDTCGNCKTAWLSGDYDGVIVCRVPTGRLEIWSKDYYPNGCDCLHYERREA